MFNIIKNLFINKEKESVPVVTTPKKVGDVFEVAKKPVIIEPNNEKGISFLTPEILKQVLQNNPDYKEWFDLLQKFLPEYEVNTPLRVAAFLANTAHESGNFTILEENLNYRRDRLLALFKKYFNTENVDKYVGKKILIASRIYASRMGNGPEASQEGWIYRGKGLIQITGKYNTTELSKHLNKTLSETCKYLLTKEGALVGSLFYWQKNNLNQVSDTGDITKVRKIVNGGTFGLQDVILRYNKVIGLFKN